jgi:hypothetical protein
MQLLRGEHRRTDPRPSLVETLEPESIQKVSRGLFHSQQRVEKCLKALAIEKV